MEDNCIERKVIIMLCCDVQSSFSLGFFFAAGVLLCLSVSCACLREGMSTSFLLMDIGSMTALRYCCDQDSKVAQLTVSGFLYAHSHLHKFKTLPLTCRKCTGEKTKTNSMFLPHPFSLCFPFCMGPFVLHLLQHCAIAQ